MSLMVASLIGVGVIALFNHNRDTSKEVCPTPFYGSDEYVNAFAEAFEKKQSN